MDSFLRYTVSIVLRSSLGSRMFTRLQGRAGCGAIAKNECVPRNVVTIRVRALRLPTRRNRDTQNRVEQVMGIAVGMDIALGMVSGLGHPKWGNSGRTIHVSGFAVLDAWVFAGLEQGGQKGVFEAKPCMNQQVRAIHEGDKARLHGDAVGVFDAGGQAEDLHVVAPHLAHEVGQVGEGGNDADFGRVSRRCSHRRRHAPRVRRR